MRQLIHPGPCVILIGAAAVWAIPSARADVAVVIEHQWTVGNNYFSAFAYDPNTTPNEFRTGGYGSGVDFRWSRVLDDTVEPWGMEGDCSTISSGRCSFATGTPPTRARAACGA